MTKKELEKEVDRILSECFDKGAECERNATFASVSFFAQGKKEDMLTVIDKYKETEIENSKISKM